MWDVVDRGLARGGVSRVPEDGSLEDAIAGLPADSGSGNTVVAFFLRPAVVALDIVIPY